jgi:HD-like signal output (HDOD) protein
VNVSTLPLGESRNCGALREAFASRLQSMELEVPVLPEVAAKIVALAGSGEGTGASLARLIGTDATLAAHVMRVASSAAYQPRSPIESLQHAISWLGIETVSDIAFTLAVQGRLLQVPGRRRFVAEMWTRSLTAALWSRLVVETLGRNKDVAYLEALLHEIGRPVCLQQLDELARTLRMPVSEPEFAALVDEFHVEVGVRLAGAWKLPAGIARVIRGWRAWTEAGDAAGACAVVYLSHQLTVLNTEDGIEVPVLCEDPAVAYLGLSAADALALYERAGEVRDALASHRPA